MEQRKYKAPAVEKMLDIIELMVKENKNFPVTELASRLNIPVNSVFRIMKELELRNYVYKNLSDSSYYLTGKLYYLGNAIASRIQYRNLAQGSMLKLLAYTRETVLLTKFGKDYSTLIVDQMESTEPVKFVSTIGFEYLSHPSALGKAMLAALDQNEFSKFETGRVLDRHTPFTITDMQLLKDELQKIREQGYAYDIQESCLGVKCIAAPVFNRSGLIEGAIGISGLAFRINDEHLLDYANMIVEEARLISEMLGYKKD